MEFVSDLVKKLKPHMAEMINSLVTGVVKFALLRVDGDVLIEGTARRIKGDFSTLTPNTTRVAFQTTTANGPTRLIVIPNGSSNVSGLDMFNAPDTENACWFGITQTNVRAQLNIIKKGTGTLVPLRLAMNTIVVFEIDTNGNVNISPASRIKITSTAAPTDTPSGGGYLFVENGALKYKGSNGTVTTVAGA